MQVESFIGEVAEKAFQWVLTGAFFAAQAFVATGGVQTYLLS